MYINLKQGRMSILQQEQCFATIHWQEQCEAQKYSFKHSWKTSERPFSPPEKAEDHQKLQTISLRPTENKQTSGYRQKPETWCTSQCLCEGTPWHSTDLGLFMESKQHWHRVMVKPECIKVSHVALPRQLNQVLHTQVGTHISAFKCRCFSSGNQYCTPKRIISFPGLSHFHHLFHMQVKYLT